MLSPLAFFKFQRSHQCLFTQLRRTRELVSCLWRPTLSGQECSRTCNSASLQSRDNGTPLQSSSIKSKSKVLLYGLDLKLSSIIARENEYHERIRLRNMNIDIQKLMKEIRSYIELHQRLDDVTEKRAAAHFEIKSGKNVDELRKTAIALREEDKNVRKLISTAEKVLYPSVLKLPNDLHAHTPTDSDVIKTYGTIKTHPFPIQTHILLGYMNNCLEFSVVSPQAYYLKGRLALLELALLRFFSEKLSQQGFRFVSSPDFCKSTVLNCSQGSTHPSGSFEVEEVKDLLLRGGASVEAFISHFTGTVVPQNRLPMRWYSTGRFYGSDDSDSKTPVGRGLFSVLQSTRIQCSAACLDCNQTDKQVEAILNCAVSAYEKLGLPFRIRYLSAKLLKPVESLKIMFELWSPSLKDYVPSGYVVEYGDLLSQRLSMMHGMGRTGHGYLHVVSACMASVPPIIACIMENLQTIEGNFRVPDVLRSYSGSVKFDDIENCPIP